MAVQPFYEAQANLEHPVTRGMTGVWNLISPNPRNARLNKFATINTVVGYPTIMTPGGRAQTGHPTGATDTFKTINLESGTTELVTGTDATFLWYGVPRNLVSDYGNAMCRGSDASGNGSSLRLRVKSDGNVEWSYVDTSPAGFTATTSGLGATVDNPVLAVAIKRGTTVQVWAKAGATIKTASASGGNGNLRTSSVGVGLNWTGNATLTAGGASSIGHNAHILAATWNRALADSEAFQLLRDPFLLVAPIMPSALFGVTAAGGAFKPFFANQLGGFIGVGVS